MATEKYLLEIQGTADALETVTTHVFTTDDATANDTLNSGEDLIVAWADNAIDQWLAFQSERYQLSRLTARRINPTGSAVAHRQYEWLENVGAVSGDFVSGGIAPCVRLIPGTLGRPAGRCFLPTPPASAIDQNVYDGTWLSDVQSYFTQLINGITSAYDWALQVHNKKLATYTNVVGFNLSPRIGYQSRRRKPIY